MRDWLKPGVKVVCINDASAPMLVRDCIYTIAGFDTSPGFDHLGFWCDFGVYLDEADPDEEGGFSPYRFRPLTKRSTDAQVSKLKRLLNTTPADLEREGV